jgi:hypothetical protein
MVHRILEVQTNAAGHDFFSGSIFEGTANLANGLSFTPLALRVVPELDCADVSANSVVMAALGGGHPEKHEVFHVMTGWPGQAMTGSKNSPMFSWLLLLAETSG